MAFTTPTNVATGDVLTASRYNAEVVANTLAGGPIYATTAARDADIPAPFAGQQAFVTATNVSYQYSGTTWVETSNIGTWTSWTPTLSSGFSNGNATTVGRYLKIGKSIFYWGAITFGTTTVKGAIMKLSVPVPATSAIAACALTSIFGSPNGTQMLFTPLQDTVSIFEAVTMTSSMAYVGSAQTTATVPFTWGTGDVVRYGGTYEAATA